MKHRELLSVVLFVFALGCGDRSALEVFGPATGLSEAGTTVSGSSGGSPSSSLSICDSVCPAAPTSSILMAAETLYGETTTFPLLPAAVAAGG